MIRDRNCRYDTDPILSKQDQGDIYDFGNDQAEKHSQKLCERIKRDEN